MLHKKLLAALLAFALLFSVMPVTLFGAGLGDISDIQPREASGAY